MRLTPLPPDQWDEQAREALASVVSAERISGVGVGNLMATLVRHPMLTRAYLPFGFYLQRDSTLPPRVREMVILRVAHRTECEYEWAHHVGLGRQVGLSDAEIAAATADHGDGVAAAALRAVDELLAGFCVSDDTWTALADHLDERQRMDLIFTIGGYLLLAAGINTFGVQPEGQNWRNAAHDLDDR
ncbi:carboxymuconolactone decarboxylase family protein [Mycobacterium arosiense]|uniref:Carboxymuconolactone decarboxylase n=1 Tax=Mycobacterium arosiense ATCC BAA-1401 = DSM 45069 TaxID=1265311 RepID=A0A1W9ZNR3_MYCAI|nr:carboxymuconolactone decarboxylase family protein [Mycobacterium arosiense]ORA19477.1 carboxymuconolactone decarboxylase [Mycobacterium arosiense ATCC BAA-1401 = DSM 45069]